MTYVVPMEIIENKIFLIRGMKVMLDRDLAPLYGIETRNLNQAVKRNVSRFPKDFMFQLNKKELEFLTSQTGISKKTGETRGGRQYLPYVFTEQGVAMLSSVLRSEKAVQVNIQIMRTFIRLREIMLTHADLKKKIEDIITRQESKFEDYDDKIFAIFEAINKLLAPPPAKEIKIGFLADRKVGK